MLYRNFTKRSGAFEEAANASVAADYLIPGNATYNYWKSVGRSIADESDITSPSLRSKQK